MRSRLGTFFFAQLAGLSITLFAMVLAIGVEVADAIVVAEAVRAKMKEKHLSPYRATMEVLHEISGAIITPVMTVAFAARRAAVNRFSAAPSAAFASATAASYCIDSILAYPLTHCITTRSSASQTRKRNMPFLSLKTATVPFAADDSTGSVLGRSGELNSRRPVFFWVAPASNRCSKHNTGWKPVPPEQ